MGLILSILAYISLLILSPIGLVWSCIKRPKEYFWRIAISLDQLGNVVCGEPMNFLFIQDWSMNQFGNPDETISSVLGKNQLNGTLKPLGKNLVLLLGKLDNNHSIKSIERDEKFRAN